MRKFLLLSGFILSLNSLKAQQLHFTSQFLQHNSMYNPAAAGISNKNLLGVTYRSMWSSFPGNPRTYMVYGDFELKKLGAGIGTYVYRDETGPTSRTGVQLAYSKHIRTRKENQKFAIGLELRALQFAIDRNKLSASLGNDPILAGAANKFGVDAGAGVYYTDGKFSAGAAVSQLIQSKLQLADVPNAKEGGKLYRHYNVTANYRFNAGGDIYVIPNVMARFIQNAPSEFDFGAKMDYQDKIWWALNWRVRQFWSIQAGMKIVNRLRLTYSYDYYVTPISVFTDGSGAHEVGLQFDLMKK